MYPFFQGRGALLVLLFVAPLALGCGKSALPPPVTIQCRDSIWGHGKVVVITNASNHHLYNVRVTGRNFEQVSSASVRATNHLAPGATVEVGWLEFAAWVPQSGESIEVHADDYAAPAVGIIP